MSTGASNHLASNNFAAGICSRTSVAHMLTGSTKAPANPWTLKGSPITPPTPVFTVKMPDGVSTSTTDNLYL
eukprot:1503313-Pyramimonas_sp.AAC.1